MNFLMPGSVKLLESRRSRPEIITQDLRMGNQKREAEIRGLELKQKVALQSIST